MSYDHNRGFFNSMFKIFLTVSVLILFSISTSSASVMTAWRVDTATGNATSYGSAWTDLEFTTDGFWGVKNNQLYSSALHGILDTPTLTGTIVDIAARDQNNVFVFTEEGYAWRIDTATGNATNYGSAWTDLEFTTDGFWGVKNNQLYSSALHGILDAPSLMGTITDIDARDQNNVFVFTEEGDAWRVDTATGNATNYGSAWTDLEFTTDGFWGVKNNQLYSSAMHGILDTPTLSGTIVDIAARDQNNVFVFTRSVDIPEPSSILLFLLGLIAVAVNYFFRVDNH